jgi:predicted HTH transcriptional regulator
VGLSKPESELLERFTRTENILIYVLISALTLGVASVVFLASSYGRQLGEIEERPKYSAASEEELLALIRGGEHQRVEFKSTLRWNLKAKKPGNEIARAWLKTLVAFLNTDGGTLLIGVEDSGHVLGIEADQFPNEDKFLLHFNNLVKQHVGLEHAASISAAIRSVMDKRIMVIDCEESKEPVFFKQGDDEEFYVRVGSGTRRLPISKVLDYTRSRSMSR